MKVKSAHIHLSITAFCLLILIFNANTSAEGAQEGLSLCIQTIIPSLFPFFLLTTYLNPMLWSVSPVFTRRLCKQLAIPKGCEGILMLGLIGGYPVGAQSISEAYRAGKISKQQAQIFMGYCNNAGPAFIFGVAGRLFTSPIAAWLLWLIHVLSALLTGFILPKVHSGNIESKNIYTITFTQAFQKSIWVTASVCGWIIVFKVLLAILIARLPSSLNSLQLYWGGILELSGGCLALNEITSYSLCFILSSAFLSFGGVCVLMQTISVTSELGLGLYLPGKLIQTAFSILFSLLIIILRDKSALHANVLWTLIPLSSATICVLSYICRKRYGNHQNNDV